MQIAASGGTPASVFAKRSRSVPRRGIVRRCPGCRRTDDCVRRGYGRRRDRSSRCGRRTDRRRAHRPTPGPRTRSAARRRFPRARWCSPPCPRRGRASKRRGRSIAAGLGLQIASAASSGSFSSCQAAKPAVEHRDSGVPQPAQQPPEPCGVGSGALIVGNHLHLRIDTPLPEALRKLIDVRQRVSSGGGEVLPDRSWSR